MRDRQRIFLLWAAMLCAGLAGPMQAADAPTPSPDAKAPAVALPQASTAPSPAAGDETAGLVRVTKDWDVWVDLKRKLVVIDGQVCLREGQLEMFACPKNTKEHEAIVSVNCKEARFVHAALIAVGAQPGKPASFDPVYRPASGSIIDVHVLWRDDTGKKHSVRAQEWIKELKSQKAMTHEWVFAGSGFYKDETTGQQYYQADGGDFICVSNFPSAMLDVTVASSQANAELMFAAFTERIPPLGTKVRLVLIPRSEQKKAAAKAEKPTPAEQPAPN